MDHDSEIGTFSPILVSHHLRMARAINILAAAAGVFLWIIGPLEVEAITSGITVDHYLYKGYLNVWHTDASQHEVIWGAFLQCTCTVPMSI